MTTPSKIDDRGTRIEDSDPRSSGRPGGKRYWRGLEEWVETPAFQEWVQREFPDHAAEWTDPLTRRQFLLLMGASLALAGVSGCSVRPAEIG